MIFSSSVLADQAAPAITPAPDAGEACVCVLEALGMKQ
jgi:hypothetical protein